ncbi:MAG: sensor histidine kinase [Anaerolineae bacterium]|nr:sensor histidine kinase [Anaerolineae bacterium]
MPGLREFLAAQRVLVAFFHGQAFFVLALSIAFLIGRSFRLEISRGLAALALFGLCEALVAWFPLLTPAMGVLPTWLAWVRLLILGAGYAFFLTFALQSYFPFEMRSAGKFTMPPRRILVAGFLLLWIAGLGITCRAGVPPERVRVCGEIIARYGMVIPGGLIGMWGLRRHTYRTVGRERLPLVTPHLRVTGAALGFFALVGGLVGPAAPFFPVTMINEELFLRVTGVPIELLRGLCGVAITYGIVRAFNVILSEIELWLENMERRQALTRERERIGRELHDGAIQAIYAAGLMLESAYHTIPSDPQSARALLARVIESLNQTIKEIRRYIFDLRGEMLEYDLETGLHKIIGDFRVNTLLEAEFVVKGEGRVPLGIERRQHIFQIAREALANAARHAKARRVEVSLTYNAQNLELRISDDGVGLSALPIGGEGQGLRNIRERARLLDGKLEISTAPNKGMTLTLTVPY